MGWMMGIEPTTTGATIRSSTTELHPPYRPEAFQLQLPFPIRALPFNELARPAGLEPATYGLEGRCSIRLSYKRILLFRLPRRNLCDPEITDHSTGCGRSGGIRTPDILLPKQARYQTALHSAGDDACLTPPQGPRRALRILRDFPQRSSAWHAPEGSALCFPAPACENQPLSIAGRPVRPPHPTARGSAMSAQLIDGKSVAARVRQQVARQVQARRDAGARAPGLAVVLVGEDPASAVYVRNKHNACVEAGIESFRHQLPAETSQEELEALVERLNADPAVDGILVQLPLPAHLDARPILERIRPDKDVDRKS